jgi:hypothetical protein
MARNYAEELDTWVTQREVTGREKNLVTFHAVRDDIQTALEAGFAAKTIWAHMRTQGRISYGYNTFRFYVNRFIRKSQVDQPGVRPGQDTQVDLSKLPGSRPSAPPPAEPARTQTATPASLVSSLASPAASISSTPPPPTRRTGMPTFTFNPIPNPEDLR